jgi:hypothetical protein
MPAVPFACDEAPATHLECMGFLYKWWRLALVTDSACDLGQLYQLFQQPLFLLAGLCLLFRNINQLLQDSTHIHNDSNLTVKESDYGKG